MAIPTPLAFWKFDESSGNALDTVSGGTQNTLVNNNTVSYVSGKFGNAADFSGGNTKYFSLADASQVGFEPASGSYSFGGWYYIDAVLGGANQAMTFFAKFGGGTDRSYSLNYDTYNYNGRTSHITLNVYDAAGTQVDLEGAFTPTTGSWQHYIAVLDAVNDTMNIYINGSLFLTKAWTGSGAKNSTVEVKIGGSGNQDWINGKVDAIGFWNVALTSTDVSDLYAAGVQYPFGVISTAKFFQLVEKA